MRNGRFAARTIRNVAAAVMIAAAAASCAVKYPETRTDTVDERPQLVVANAGEGAVLIVDGVTIGPAQNFDGKPGALRLPEGTHVVEIQQNGVSVLKETVFLTDAVTRTISVPVR